ncbi:MAG: metallophosphoesterase [Pseudomonadota bacterium]
MPEIRYLCLSDLHLGEEDGLLTDYVGEKKAPKPTEVLKKLSRCLRFTIEDCNTAKPGKPAVKPILVLNGDTLEFALSSMNQAVMAFEVFLKEIMPPGREPLFGKILFIPGNHDHHVWETARETQYVEYFSSPKAWPADKFLKRPWHTTNVFLDVEGRDSDGDKGVPAYMLQSVLRRLDHLKGIEIRTAYPNLGIVAPEKNKCVVFTHGHYIESLYHLMSKLKTQIIPGRKEPEEIWDIEEENFSWIDFFWSTMGSAGQVGEGLERIYEAFQKHEEAAVLLANFLKSMLGLDLGYIKQQALEYVMSQIVTSIIQRERGCDDAILGPEAVTGLDAFMDALLRQIDNEIENRPTLGLTKRPALTLVLGHTHKPFSWSRNSPERPSAMHTKQPMYNTGGWIVETVDPAPKHGASVMLVDENMSTCGIRVYNESEDGVPKIIHAETADDPSPDSQSFDRAVRESIVKRLNEWESLGLELTGEVDNRREALRGRASK